MEGAGRGGGDGSGRGAGAAAVGTCGTKHAFTCDASIVRRSWKLSDSSSSSSCWAPGASGRVSLHDVVSIGVCSRLSKKSLLPTRLTTMSHECDERGAAMITARMASVPYTRTSECSFASWSAAMCGSSEVVARWTVRSPAAASSFFSALVDRRSNVLS